MAAPSPKRCAIRESIPTPRSQGLKLGTRHVIRPEGCPPLTSPVPPQVADVVAYRMKDQSVFQHVKIGDIAKYKEYGIETVDHCEMLDAGTKGVLPHTRSSDIKTVDEVFLLVMETGEMEEAVGGGITFLRDAMACVKTTRDNRSQGDYEHDMFIVRDDKMSMVAYAVLAVGDTDAMPERAMYRSKQNTAGDCNQAGQLADKVMKQLGGVRVCPRGEIDVARDQVERDVAAFIDRRLLPALVP